MMLRIIFTAILCLLINPLWAQEVSNVQVQQNGEELMVTFDIAGTEEDYLVTIELAEDGEHFHFFEKMKCHPGKSEFRKELKEQVFSAAGVFRVRVEKIIFITDIDGNKYKIIKIGNQEWMKENLKTSKYRDGTQIPTALDKKEWSNTKLGAYAIYDNDRLNNTKYGKLYNWYAVADPRGLCPVGWHIPSEAEWTTLINFLGGVSVAGGKLKAVSSLWLGTNTGATNESDFSALPGGYRYDKGHYNAIDYEGDWWSYTKNSSITGYTCYLNFNNATSFWNYYSFNFGFSVRCLKD